MTDQDFEIPVPRDCLILLRYSLND